MSRLEELTGNRITEDGLAGRHPADEPRAEDCGGPWPAWPDGGSPDGKFCDPRA